MTQGSTPAGSGAHHVGDRAEVLRSVMAPTEEEASLMAAPMLDAFRDAGWRLAERTWIPGDRRVGLGESLLLDASLENMLEADGTLRFTFDHPDPAAVAPAAAPAAREPDLFEQIGGVRYRRVVPRVGLSWAISGVALIVFLLFLVFVFLPQWNAMSRPGFGFGGPDTVVIEGQTLHCDDRGVCTSP